MGAQISEKCLKIVVFDDLGNNNNKIKTRQTMKMYWKLVENLA